jgi:glycosyltransferase involved in cell wall biosynthesis
MPPYWIDEFKPTFKVRPYFGWIGRYANGPGNRTKRMIEEFGNYYINPNLVYAQSGWSSAQLENTITDAIRRNVPVVINQNGWYYPAWYAGDWKKANSNLIQFHNRSSRVIFQSKFCVEAMFALTGVLPENPLIVHNAVAVPTANPPTRNPTRPTLWLSGAFHKDADHILLPALEAVSLLAQEWKDNLPLLKIAGHFDLHAQKSDWFGKVKRKIAKLQDDGVCSWIGKYTPSELPELTNDVALALHLTSKDSCPNAVLERMALGIGHVYANSGGTPELVGDAGVAVSSPIDWSRQTAVNTDELVYAIKCGFEQWRSLSSKSFARVCGQFSWDTYVIKHNQIFASVMAEN